MLTSIATPLAVASLVAWLVALLDFRRRFPAGRRLPGTPAPAGTARIAAVVPARNEAASLPDTLPRLLAQAPPLDRIVVVDDRSTDGTADAVEAVAASAAPGSPEVGLVRVESLAEGWMGKVHAQARGVERAGDDVEWILFTDADIAHGPTVSGRLLAQAEAGPFDMVSVMARLRTETAWERLLMPAFVYFFQAMYPFRRASDPTSSVAAAAGGCVLVRRKTLADAGGPAAYRDAVIDDLALARTVKGAGGRLWIGFDDDVVSTRAYPRLADLVDMIARSAFDELGYRYVLVGVVWIGLALLFLVPPAATVVGAATGDGRLGLVGLAGWLLATASAAPAFQLYGMSAARALLMPVAAVVYAWATTLSALRHARGRALRWR